MGAGFVTILAMLFFAHLCEASEHGPGSETHLDRAIEKAAVGDHKAAVQEASRAINKSRSIPDAYFIRGISQAALGRYADAVSDYTKAIELKPNYAMAYLNRGQALGMIGDYKGELADPRKLSSLLQTMPKPL